MTDKPVAAAARLAAHPAWIELDEAALGANLAEVRQRVGDGVQIIASVKANAYGHGIVPVARSLAAAGVDMLATGSFDEAAAIRRAGITTPVLMLAGALPEATATLRDHDLVPTVFNQETADIAAGTDAGPTPVFVKVDCGLGRVGVTLDQAARFITQLAVRPDIDLQGIYTHLAFKDAASMAWTEERLPLFYALIRELKAAGIDPPVTQALASSALLMGWRDDLSAVCPGHVLYGLSPVVAGFTDIAPFRPVLRAIKARVIHIGDHGAGPPPGGGGYHRRRQGRRTAVVPCGLNDGYRPARPGQSAVVLCQGRRLAVLGVSLEHLTFDVPDELALSLGDTVVLAGSDGGESISLDELAGWQGATPATALVTLGAGLPMLDS